MKDNSDIPLPLDQLRSRVLVFAITDEATHEYEEITKGYVELSTDEDGKNHTFHYLQVKDEQTNEVLMRSNLNIENNFGKQKGSIISWTDDQQPQYQEIALSFEKDQQCDMFWRTICQKIGKSYLEINGMQKLQAPTVNNLNYILQKAKNSIDLMDYNIVHSKTIMEGLREVFYQMRRTGDEFGMGTIWRIINAILSPAYSSNAIQTIMTGDNFYLILDLQEFRKGIEFRRIYEQKVGQYLKNKFNLPREIFEKIELSHRAVFYRENVLELSQQGLLQSVMFMICKQAQGEIMSYLNRSKFLQTLINYTDYPHELSVQQKIDKLDERQQQQQQQSSHQQLQSQQAHNQPHNQQHQPPSPQTIAQLTYDKLQFLQQAITMHNQITGEQIKQTFKQNIYQSGVLQFIKHNIDQLNLKAIQILNCITQIDKLKFFEFLIDNFRLNSTDNLLKSLMKLYLNHSQVRYSVIVLVEGLVPLFNLKKELLDFFVGTFVCSVFAVAKDPRAILLLANVLLAQLQNSSVLFPQLIKLKICQKLASQYRNGSSLKSKSQQLQILKFLKYIIIQQSHKGQSKNKQIQKNLIDSGLMECCMMIYMKYSQRYNVISSSMLENLKIIEKMEFSQLDVFIVREYAISQEHSNNDVLSRILKPIRDKYISHMNKKMQTKHEEQDYLEVQRIVHEEILQNEHQDTYLMNEDYEEPSVSKTNGNSYGNNSLNSEPNHMHDSNIALEENQQQKGVTRKQDQLMFLKRMMDEIKEDEEQTIQRGPRKIVKRSQDSKQTAIQFCFDLPDMDQIASHQLQST